ncbi:MAG: hypothetical protein A2X86_03040 [Bdellovibrionales bacterium GWA2_49_15]|nr:MAG: hypothetical protein A2X86_03040 [Bdellovibrionales bacterium GWA2_49_15]
MASKINILVVEDSDILRMGLVSKLKKFGQVYETAHTSMAKRILSRDKIDLAFIDMNIDGEMDGLEVIEEAVKHGIYAVVLSSEDRDEVVEKAYIAGSKDYYVKGDEENTIETVVGRFLMNGEQYKMDSFFENEFITQDEKTKRVLTVIAEARNSDLPLLILGPTGCGKTLVAKKIHALSSRKGKLVEVNCSALTETLLESELFGHMKGAFTGATGDKKGLLTEANGGTIFLDEIGTMPMSLQMKLLKALEDKCFLPVGGTEMVKSDFRVVSATCDDLLDKITVGTFRRDLFYRISGINIALTPLIERPGDISLLINHFLKKANRRIVLSKDARKKLEAHDWPGNVRELEKVIGFLVQKNRGLIDMIDIPTYIVDGKSDRPKSEKESLLTDLIRKYCIAHGLYELLEQIKLELIQETLGENSGKVNQTISELGISNNTFYKTISKVKQSHAVQ